jgi:hypothetical protein
MSLSILEKPAIRKRVPAISIEGYHELFRLGFIPEKTELIEGVVVEKMPKDPIHAGLVQKIVFFLIRNLSEQFQVRQENPLSLIDSEPEPDISIVDKDENDYLLNHPTKAEVRTGALGYYIRTNPDRSVVDEREAGGTSARLCHRARAHGPGRFPRSGAGWHCRRAPPHKPGQPD